MFYPSTYCLQGHIIFQGLLSPGGILSPKRVVSGTGCLRGGMSFGWVVSWRFFSGAHIFQGGLSLGGLSWGMGHHVPPLMDGECKIDHSKLGVDWWFQDSNMTHRHLIHIFWSSLLDNHSIFRTLFDWGHFTTFTRSDRLPLCPNSDQGYKDG